MSYQFDEFERCKDQPFSLKLEGQSIALKLISVERHPSSDTVDGIQAFSVIFRDATNVALQQQIYRIENDELGSMELFIVPIGPDDEGMRYEAVFA